MSSLSYLKQEYMGDNWFGTEWGVPLTRYAGVIVRTYQRRSGDYHIFLLNL